MTVLAVAIVEPCPQVRFWTFICKSYLNPGQYLCSGYKPGSSKPSVASLSLWNLKRPSCLGRGWGPAWESGVWNLSAESFEAEEEKAAGTWHRFQPKCLGKYPYGRRRGRCSWLLPNAFSRTRCLWLSLSCPLVLTPTEVHIRISHLLSWLPRPVVLAIQNPARTFRLLLEPFLNAVAWLGNNVMFLTNS